MKIVSPIRSILVNAAILSSSRTVVMTLKASSSSVSGDFGNPVMERINECQFFVYDEVTSTMDKAREILDRNSGIAELNDNECGSVQLEDSFSVLAKFQNKGRGTRGRTWNSGEGNMFMTVVVNLKSIPSPLTLVPLRVGTLISPHIRSRVPDMASRTYLKWPNDILIGEKKVCGTLIEIENNHMLIGIGCNIVTAPNVVKTGVDKGRESTSIAEYNTDIAHTRADSSLAGEEARVLAGLISASIKGWLRLEQDPAAAVAADFFNEVR